MMTFPTNKIKEVENAISQKLNIFVELSVTTHQGYNHDKFETLESEELIEKLPVFAKAMWNSYKVICKFGILKSGEIRVVADVKYENISYGTNGQQIADFII